MTVTTGDGTNPLLGSRTENSAITDKQDKAIPAKFRRIDNRVRARRGPPATKWELPLTMVYGNDWRVLRATMTITEWAATEEHFVTSVSEVWDLKGYWTKKDRKDAENIEVEGRKCVPTKKGSHKLTGKKTASTTPKYLHHPADVYWQSGGRGRIKFIVDNQALANIVNGRQKLGESPLTAVFKRFIRACTTIFKHQYYPQTNIGDMVQWRSRDFNQQADHIANVTLDRQSGQYYCDKKVMREAKEAKANFLIFSDGGYRSSIPCSVGAYIIYAVFDNYTRPVVAQGIIIRGYSGSLPAEAVALEPLRLT